ncbi:hypothetical protein [Streptomyces sp. LN704]
MTGLGTRPGRTPTGDRNWFGAVFEYRLAEPNVRLTITDLLDSIV